MTDRFVPVKADPWGEQQGQIQVTIPDMYRELYRARKDPERDRLCKHTERSVR